MILYKVLIGIIDGIIELLAEEQEKTDSNKIMLAMLALMQVQEMLESADNEQNKEPETAEA